MITAWFKQITYFITYSMQQSPSWKANGFSASQKIPRMLRNPKVHYRIQKCPSSVPIPSQLNPFQTPTSQSLNIHLNNIFPSTPGSPKWSLSLRFPYLNPVYDSPIRATCPAHLNLLDFIARKIYALKNKSFILEKNAVFKNIFHWFLSFSSRLFSFNKQKKKYLRRISLSGLDFNIVLAKDNVNDVINLSHMSEGTYCLSVLKLIQIMLFRITIFLYIENQLLY
jgi:hypothetical protein